MAFSMYSTAAMLRAVELMPVETNFLMDMFGQIGDNVEDTEAIYDQKKFTVQMAPFVSDGMPDVLIGRDGFDTKRIGFARMAPARIVTLQDISTRSFGEKMMGGMTPAERARKMLSRDLLELTQACMRRRAWMVRQMMLTGKCEIFRYTREGRDKQTLLNIDYGFTNNYTPDTKWDQADADPSYDMERIVDLVAEGSGNVDRIVMAADVASALLENEKFMKHMDRINERAGQINARYMGYGVRYIGINKDGIEMYSCSGKFRNDRGLLEKIIPDGTLIAGSAGAVKIHHGPITKVEGQDENSEFQTYIKQEVPFRIGSSESDTIKIRMVSCPTAMPENIDGWAIAKVLTPSA